MYVMAPDPPTEYDATVERDDGTADPKAPTRGND